MNRRPKMKARMLVIDGVPCAVIPFASQRVAKDHASFANRSYNERVNLVVEALMRYDKAYSDARTPELMLGQASTILRALNLDDRTWRAS